MAAEVGDVGRKNQSVRSLGYEQFAHAVEHEIRHHLNQARKSRSVRLLLMRHAAADAVARLFGRLKPSGKRAMEDYEHFIDLVHDIRLLMPASAAIVAFSEAKRDR